MFIVTKGASGAVFLPPRKRANSDLRPGRPTCARYSRAAAAWTSNDPADLLHAPDRRVPLEQTLERSPGSWRLARYARSACQTFPSTTFDAWTVSLRSGC